jgi:FtsH-binding integral membrane protein
LDHSALSSGGRAKVYGLVALALLITLFGVFAGISFALPLIASGWVFILFVLELAIVFTARFWIRSSPLNFILFLCFPFLSGLTITPFLLGVIDSYANGAVILLNAAIATTLLTAAAALVASMTRANIGSVIGPILFNALIGLIIFGILQIFIPALRGTGFEMIVSSVGIVTFGGFLAYDLQRLQRSMLAGESPFILALSLYLDIFNLFLYIVRFMLAFGGRRR